MSKPSSKCKKQAATAKQQPVLGVTPVGPTPPLPPTPTPPTHIVLPLQVRDAMIRQLGEVPWKFGVAEVIGALRNAPTTTVHSSPAGGAPKG